MVLFYISSQPAYCCQGNFSNLNTECIPQIFSFCFKRGRCQLPESIKKSFSSWYTLNIQWWMITAKLFILLDTHQSELDGPSWGLLLTLSILLLSSIVTFQFCYFPVLLLSRIATFQFWYFPVVMHSCFPALTSSLPSMLRLSSPLTALAVKADQESTNLLRKGCELKSFHMLHACTESTLDLACSSSHQSNFNGRFGPKWAQLSH